MNTPLAIVLAAGKSERMASNKMFLELSFGESFIQHIVSSYLKFGCQQVSIVVNRESYSHSLFKRICWPKGTLISINEKPELGRFYSLQLGLLKLKANCNVFIHNVDNPFCGHKLLNKLNSSIEKFDIAIPTFEGKGGHPILVSSYVSEQILHANSNEVLNVFLKNFRTTSVDFESDIILQNVNTPSDYQNFLKRPKN